MLSIFEQKIKELVKKNILDAEISTSKEYFLYYLLECKNFDVLVESRDGNTDFILYNKGEAFMFNETLVKDEFETCNNFEVRNELFRLLEDTDTIFDAFYYDEEI